MIHYITQNGIGNAWVANELSRVDAAGVPFVLHSMRRPDKLLNSATFTETSRILGEEPSLTTHG